MSTTSTAPSIAELQQMAQAAAAKYGVPFNLLSAQINQESGWSTTVVSKSGCVGIAQICDNVSFDPTDPAASLDYMAKRMAGAYAQYGDWGKALASYNCGPSCCGNGNVGDMSCWPSETISYVGGILSKAGMSNTGGFLALPPGGFGSVLTGSNGGIDVTPTLPTGTDPFDPLGNQKMTAIQTAIQSLQQDWMKAIASGDPTKIQQITDQIDALTKQLPPNIQPSADANVNAPAPAPADTTDWPLFGVGAALLVLGVIWLIHSDNPASLAMRQVEGKTNG